MFPSPAKKSVAWSDSKPLVYPIDLNDEVKFDDGGLGASLRASQLGSGGKLSPFMSRLLAASKASKPSPLKEPRRSRESSMCGLDKNRASNDLCPRVGFGEHPFGLRKHLKCRCLLFCGRRHGSCGSCPSPE
jgi:hypothetical protein